MTGKRLNIMLYSNISGEQIILPVNPKNIEIKYSKSFEKYEILGFGEINTAGNALPLNVVLSCFLPEDDSAFALGSRILYANNNYMENNYSLSNAINIFTKWAKEKNKIRLVIDEELNIEGVVKSFNNNVRESTKSRMCTLEILEHRNPDARLAGSFGLYKRVNNMLSTKTMLLKKGETIYSIANKLGVDFKVLAKRNNISDANIELAGTIISLLGVI